MAVVRSLEMEIDRTLEPHGAVWVGAAPWHLEPIEGETFEDVYWLLMKERPQ